jgi:hypothetical protein
MAVMVDTPQLATPAVGLVKGGVGVVWTVVATCAPSRALVKGARLPRPLGRAGVPRAALPLRGRERHTPSVPGTVPGTRGTLRMVDVSSAIATT